jgi:hypothetical protein
MRPVTMDLTEVVTRDTYSAPKRFTPTKATPKSRADKTRYTPRAYQPYDLMSCFNRCDREVFGGRTGDEEGEGVKRGGKFVNKRRLKGGGVGFTRKL